MLHTLPQIIENAARLFPERDAFRCGKETLSYSELNERTDKLAKYLVESGVRKGDRVGIYMERCLETAIAIYGIMKAGAAYVPLDPLAPHSRTSFLLDNCGIEHVVATKKQTKRITAILDSETKLKTVVGIPSELSIPTISWETIFDIDLSGFIPVEILESDLAYVMYTSGSTGAPKGIMHTHHSGLTYARLSSSLYDLSGKDRVANHAPLHFDISTFGYFSAPFAGATTVIIPDAYTKLPASLSTLMEQEKITVWYSVPLALIQLLLNGVLDKRNLSALRWVLYGGENFIPKHLKNLMLIWPHATFSNVYGPAEVNQCTYYNFKTPPEDDTQIPLGKIWDNTYYKIFDINNKEVPKGATGELIVRTATMMKGYWNNIELTEKSIYTEQIAVGVENRYYRTGDLVREDKNGNLFFLGRNDRQIKVRGYRVELDEVEAVVSRHEKVKEAAVFIVVNENEEKEIAAAIIGISEIDDTSSEVLSFCKSQLPSYAVPNNIYVLTDFPRTSSGKIKRSEIQKKLIS